MRNPSTRASIATAFLILLFPILGCKNGGSYSDAGSGVSRSVGSDTPTSPDGATRLTSGPATLNYLLPAGGQIRVVDLATGKTVITATAPPQAVISIDDNKGVTVANKVVKPGPFPPGHRYELWLDHP